MPRLNLIIGSLFFLAATLLLAACGESSTNTPAPVAGSTPTVPAPTSTVVVTPLPPTAIANTSSPTNTVPSSGITASPAGTISGGTPMSGEILPKEAVTAILNDLKSRINANIVEKDIQVVSFTQTEFSDSSLGCPSPDAMYTQVITPGYRTSISYNGKTYDYRVNTRGFRVVLCDPITNQPVKKTTP